MSFLPLLCICCSGGESLLWVRPQLCFGVQVTEVSPCFASFLCLCLIFVSLLRPLSCLFRLFMLFAFLSPACGLCYLIFRFSVAFCLFMPVVFAVACWCLFMLVVSPACSVSLLFVA